MDRPPRHRAALGALAAGLIAAAHAGCDDATTTCAARAAVISITAPPGFAELQLDGLPVELAWTADEDPAGFTVTLVDGSTRHPLASLPGAARGLRFDGTGADGERIPPGNYTLELGVTCALDDVTTLDGGGFHLVVVQGVRFRDATLSFTGAQTTRDVHLTTVSRSAIDLELAVADPTGVTRTFTRAAIPGELVPVERSYPFTGDDLAGAPIPAGTYTIVARVRTAAGATPVERPGPVLTWMPGALR